jgi:nifR3 family TIM-barrel protein
MAEAAAMVEDMGFDLLDINFGCPVPKIVSPGGGSALLREPDKAREIFRAIIQRIKKIPVTVKMRLGFSDQSGEEAVRIAKIAEEEGLSAVAVHGRTRAQGYSGKADWQAIGHVKKAVRIPVIGNGDVNGPEDAQKMLEVSGCDGVMIGRGALGNPWIYKSIENSLSGKPGEINASLEEKRQAALRHLDLEIATEDPRLAVLKFRRIACWYFKNYPGNAEFRNRVQQADSAEEMRELITRFNAPPTGE